MTSIEEYRTKVAEQLKDLDIGVLVANAGIGNVGPLYMQTDKEVQDMVNVNVLHVIYTLKVLINQILERQATTGIKSGIIVTSSGLAAFPMPGFAVYSATKTFDSFIAQGLNYELSGRADVLCYEAGMVRTKFVKSDRAHTRGIAPETAAYCGLRDLGSMTVTNGSIHHEMQSYQLTYMQPIIKRLMYLGSIKHLEEQRKKGN